MSDSDVKVTISADTSSLESGSERAVDSSETIADHLEALKAKAESGADGLDTAGASATGFGAALSSMGQIASGVLGGLELSKVADQFKELFTESIFGASELGEKLSNLSLSTGISTDGLERLRYAATLAGVNFDMLQRSVSQLALKMLQLSAGGTNKALATAMSDLGLTPDQLSDSEHALDNIAAAVQRIGISQRTIGDVSEILGGRGGARLMPLLATLADANAEFDRTNQLIGTEGVEATARAQRQMNEFAASWDRLKFSVGAAVAGPLTEGANWLTDLTNSLRASNGSLITFIDTFTHMKAERAGFDAAKAFTPPPAPTIGGGFYDASTKVADFSGMTNPAVAMAAAAKPALVDSERDWAEWGKAVEDHIHAAAKASNEGLDAMFAGFKEDTMVLDHVKQKMQELDYAAEQNKEQLKADSEEIASVFEPIASAFEQSFTGVIQGTQTVSQAFAKMADSIALEMVKSGLHDLLMGGAKNTFGASLFGTTGEGGGIAGELAKAFQGSTVAAGMKSALTSAWGALTGPITTAFGSAFNAISGIIKNIFGGALQGAGSAAAGAGAGAAINAGAGAATSAGSDKALAALGKLLLTPLTMLAGLSTTQLGISVTHLGVATAHAATAVGHFAMEAGQWIVSIAQDAAYYLESMVQFLLIDLGTWTSVHPLGFSGGGIASAARGMITSGSSFGIPAILHPNEMVLPPHISDWVQRAAAGGDSGGGGGGGGGGTIVNVSLSISAIDGASVENLFNQGRVKDLIGNAVLSKIRDGRAVGQSVHRGVFRR